MTGEQARSVTEEQAKGVTGEQEMFPWERKRKEQEEACFSSSRVIFPELLGWGGSEIVD